MTSSGTFAAFSSFSTDPSRLKLLQGQPYSAPSSADSTVRTWGCAFSCRHVFASSEALVLPLTALSLTLVSCKIGRIIPSSLSTVSNALSSSDRGIVKRLQQEESMVLMKTRALKPIAVGPQVLGTMMHGSQPHKHLLRYTFPLNYLHNNPTRWGQILSQFCREETKSHR